MLHGPGAIVPDAWVAPSSLAITKPTKKPADSWLLSGIKHWKDMINPFTPIMSRWLSSLWFFGCQVDTPGKHQNRMHCSTQWVCCIHVPRHSFSVTNELQHWKIAIGPSLARLRTSSGACVCRHHPDVITSISIWCAGAMLGVLWKSTQIIHRLLQKTLETPAKMNHLKNVGISNHD